MSLSSTVTATAIWFGGSDKRVALSCVSSSSTTQCSSDISVTIFSIHLTLWSAVVVTCMQFCRCTLPSLHLRCSTLQLKRSLYTDSGRRRWPRGIQSSCQRAIGGTGVSRTLLWRGNSSLRRGRNHSSCLWGYSVIDCSTHGIKELGRGPTPLLLSLGSKFCQRRACFTKVLEICAIHWYLKLQEKPRVSHPKMQLCYFAWRKRGGRGHPVYICGFVPALIPHSLALFLGHSPTPEKDNLWNL